MTTDPFAHRVKALEAAASPQFATAGLVHAVVYLGDQLARLNDLADTVASGPPRTGNDGAPLGEVVHDEAAELVPSTAETAALTAADLDALPEGTTVYDADGDGWAKTGTRWRLDNEGRPERAATLIKVYGPLTAEHAAEQPTHGSETVLTVNELLALPDGAVVQDSDWELWEKTRLGWFMHGTAADAPTARTLSSKTLFECRGPLTVRAATN